MGGGGCTDKDKGLGKEMARVCDGHRRIIGRARKRAMDRERKKERQQQTVLLARSGARLMWDFWGQYGYHGARKFRYPIYRPML